MTLAEKYDHLAAGINPRKQVVCIHRGRTSAEGVVIEEARYDEGGLPLLDVFLVNNLNDVKWAGWEPFSPPPLPRAVRPAVEEELESPAKTRRRR